MKDLNYAIDTDETTVWVTVGEGGDGGEIAVGIDWETHDVRVQSYPAENGPVVEVPLHLLRAALSTAVNEAVQRRVVDAVSQELTRAGLGGEMHDTVLEHVDSELRGVGGLHL